MNLSRFAIENNRITFFVTGGIIVMGLVLYQSMARDSMPPYTIRVASIVTQFPGASPERVEELVTDKIEKVAQELPELKKVESTSRTGLSVVNVTLRDQVKPEDLQAVWDRLRRKIQAMSGLPDGAQPFLDDDGIGDVFGIVVGMTSDGFSYAEMKGHASAIKDAFIKLDAAARVELGGVQEERIFVEFDNARLREYNLSASRLQSIIAARNIVSSGGEVNLEDERIILEPTGSFDSIDDIRNILIPVGDANELVYLRDICRVRRGYIDPPTQRVQINGKEAISFHINLKSGANILSLGEDVDRVIAAWQERLPVGLELFRVASLDSYIDKKIADFEVNLIQAIAIVLAVMLVFLGLRTGAVIASLIPIVTVMTLMLMGLLDVGLNQITLAALIMALGMMVDNAIVVAESIMVKMEQGTAPKAAAIESCSELSVPLLISTLTTSVAFLAFFLAESTMGDIVGPIFVVISLALISSWVIALTVTTTLCTLFLKVEPTATKTTLVDRVISQLKTYYKSLILWALGRRYLAVSSVLGLFVVSLLGFGFIPFKFFPDSDRNLITVDINLPLGTRIERTSGVVGEIESYLAESLRVDETRPEGVLDWTSYIGEGPDSYDLGYNPDEANASYAHILVNTSAPAVNNVVIARLDEFCFREFPDADIKVGPLGGGGGGTPIEIKVSGDDPDALARISETIKLKLSGVAGTKNVKDDWGPKSKKFVVEVDQARAQAAGVSSQDIAGSLQTMLDGFRTGEYREDDKSIPIIMRSEGSQQQSVGALETLNVVAQNSGRSVPLLQVARIVPGWQYSKIKRLDLIRTVNVSSELTEDGNAAAIMTEMTPWLDEQAEGWPTGYAYRLGGEAENTADNMGAVANYLPLSAVIIVLLLIIQFNSFRKMTIVTLTIPLGIIGVVLGLLVFREPFGFMPFLGVISLAGIVINNAIVLLDRMQIEQRELKRSEQDAVIAACLQRFRPILLATFTTVLGLLPLYLSGGEVWEGMAISIMVGLLFGTVITLVFVPTLYSILFRVDFGGHEFDENAVRT